MELDDVVSDGNDTDSSFDIIETEDKVRIISKIMFLYSVKRLEF